jgi:hypothetical protein
MLLNLHLLPTTLPLLTTYSSSNHSPHSTQMLSYYLHSTTLSMHISHFQNHSLLYLSLSSHHLSSHMSLSSLLSSILLLYSVLVCLYSSSISYSMDKHLVSSLSLSLVSILLTPLLTLLLLLSCLMYHLTHSI